MIILDFPNGTWMHQHAVVRFCCASVAPTHSDPLQQQLQGEKLTVCAVCYYYIKTEELCYTLMKSEGHADWVGIG